MKGMIVDKYGNITFTAEAKNLSSEEICQQLESIVIEPVHETIEITGNNDGSTTKTTIDHIRGTRTVERIQPASRRSEEKVVNPAHVESTLFSSKDNQDRQQEIQESLTAKPTK